MVIGLSWVICCCFSPESFEEVNFIYLVFNCSIFHYGQVVIIAFTPAYVAPNSTYLLSNIAQRIVVMLKSVNVTRVLTLIIELSSLIWQF